MEINNLEINRTSGKLVIEGMLVVDAAIIVSPLVHINKIMKL